MLIILLMIAPMRSVMAEQDSHCEMDEMSAMTSTMSHQMHQAQSGLDESQQDEPQQAKVQDKCCCCDGNSCAGNCDMGMTASILMRDSVFTPVFDSVADVALFSSKILARALTPPTRPPLKLS